MGARRVCRQRFIFADGHGTFARRGGYRFFAVAARLYGACKAFWNSLSRLGFDIGNKARFVGDIVQQAKRNQAKPAGSRSVESKAKGPYFDIAERRRAFMVGASFAGYSRGCHTTVTMRC